MKAWWIGALATGAMLWASPSSADVRVTIGDGHVSIFAANATVRQILAEWAKVGQARIVNLDRVGGPPTTIEISNASEIEALEILLRSVGGYIIAPRHLALPNASRFDRIVILPASSVPAPTAVRPAPAAARAAPLAQPQSQVLPPPRRLDEEDDDSAEPTGAPTAAQRPATFNAFPQPARGGTQPQPGQERGASVPPPPPPVTPSSMPTAPAGVPVPGMVIPAPQAAPGAAPPR